MFNHGFWKKAISLCLLIAILCGCAGTPRMMSVHAEGSENKLILPAGLDVIDTEAFMGSTSLDSVFLPDGIKSIRFRAFAGSSIRCINLPASITFIADDAFADTSMEYVIAAKGTYAYDWAMDHEMKIQDIGEYDDENPFKYAMYETYAEVTEYCGAEAAVTVPDKAEGLPVEGIADGAFADCFSVKKVYLPYGLKRIGEKAFTGSKIKEIYIPSTVSDIAENAFEGIDELIVYTDMDSYPWQYAEEHDYTVKNQGAYYRKNNYDNKMAYIAEDAQIEEKYIDVSLYSTISTDGLTEDDYLSEVEEINGYIEKGKEYAEAYNTLADEFAADLETKTAILDEVSLTEGDDMITFTCDGLVLNVGRGILEKNDQDMEFVDFTVNEEEGGVYVLENYVLYSAAEYDAAVKSSENPVNVAKLKEIINKLSDIVNSISRWVNGSVELLENSIASDNAELKIIESILKNDPPESTLKTDLLDEQALISDRLEINEKLLKSAKFTQSKLSGLNVPGLVRNAYENIEAIIELQKIRDHGHPTADDIDGDIKWLQKAEKLNDDIVLAQVLYGSDAVISIMDIATSIATIVKNTEKFAGANPNIKKVVNFLTSGKWSADVVKEVVASASKTWAVSLHSKILATDNALHGYKISGRITSKKDNTPLQYVRVVCGGKEAVSDANGNYSINLRVGNHTIEYILDDYNTYTQNVEISNSLLGDVFGFVTLECHAWDKNNRRWYGDVQMEEATVNVSGKLIDYFWDEPVYDVTVTDGNGTVKSVGGGYSIDVPIGEQTLTFSKEGYIDFEQPLTLEYGKDIVKDIILHKETGFITGNITEYDPDTGAYTTITKTVTATCDGQVDIATFDGFNTEYAMELEPGTRTITFSAAGYNDRSITVDIKAGGKTKYNIYLIKNEIIFEPFGTTTVQGENSYQLTPLDFHQHGSIWSTTTVSTKNGLSVSFDYMAGGGHDNWAGGADGIVFQFSPTRGSSGDGSDNGLNYGAVGVELDSYYMEHDSEQGIDQKHIAIIQDYFYNHLAFQYDSRVDDSVWHTVKIDYKGGQMDVYLDGTKVLSANVKLPDNVYLGASASTGNGYNIHCIANVTVSK